ncbi:unnamed protein product [Effrenium voratum]|uniref:Uncharacterized protein n=1 Tax=Effrenium voratum TaxID=2562239 RepID=A0AA36HRF6_9DINO|nr:unnamed protein product [Effrenium voratum]
MCSEEVSDEDDKPKKPKRGGALQKSNAPKTEAAREARLRRVCERKPTGRCHVPPDIHEMWASGGSVKRKEMARMLEESGWDKDCNHVVCMQACFLNERKYMHKSDKYNKKVRKYYVEYEEDDESGNESIEREKEEEVKAGKLVKFDSLGKGKNRVTSKPRPAESEDDEAEYGALKKFGDSLLTRASKLSDLIGDVEEGCSKVTTAEAAAKSLVRNILKLLNKE